MVKPFSLHAVLKYRKQLEEKAAMRLAEALQRFQLAKKKTESADAEYRHLTARIDSLQGEGVEIHRLLNYLARKDFLEMQIKVLNEELTLRKYEVAKARSATVSKSRDRKVLEQLQEKQDSEYKRYLEKIENNQLDEIAVLSYDRNSKE